MNRQKIDEVVKSYLKEISGYRIKLDADPLAAGVGTFNSKIAEAREQANRVASVLTTAIVLKREVQASRDRLKSQLEMELRHILGGDARVYEVPEGQRSSVETRNANASRILKEQGKNLEEELADLEQLYLSVSSFYDIVKLVYDNLNETRRDLLFQISVIRTQIGIGEVKADSGLKDLLIPDSIESTQSGLVPI